MKSSQHFDATGKKLMGDIFFYLNMSYRLRGLQHLRNCGFAGTRVSGDVQIRIDAKRKVVTVVTGGLCETVTREFELTERRHNALRRTWKKHDSLWTTGMLFDVPYLSRPGGFVPDRRWRYSL